jgi:TRAP-type mannitol/chloroaromatic compound transport system permease small subunit
MRVIQKIYDGIGLVSEWSGRVVMFAVATLIVTICYDVFARYLFNAPTIWSYALSYMLGTSIIALGMPYVYYHNANVRVDVIYSKLSPKGRLVLDVVLTIFLSLPLIFMLTKVFGQDAWRAYVTHEVATETIWYPLFWPFKTVVTLSFALLFLQGIATLVRDVICLTKGGKQPW